jgi:Bifunctional DNA primase/polymerase, N-terminal
VIDISELNRVVKTAQWLASGGIPVFPVHEVTRTPLVRWKSQATTEPAIIRAMWHCFPGLLIGYKTGETSDIDVLDVDIGKHPGAVAWWEEYRPRLPETFAYETRSGGLHLLFQHQAGRRNSTSAVHPGIDVRASGGLAIWWPGAGCRIICDAALAPWPDWLDPPTPQAEKTEQRQFACTGLSRYGEAALDSACCNIIGASNGSQQATLNRECFSIGTLVGAGGLPQDFALDVLLWAARQMPAYVQARPWRIEQLEATVRRSLADGVRQPRGGRQ